MDTQKIKYSEHESLEACAAYLRQILEGMDSRNLLMSHGDEKIRLHPTGPVRFKLKVKQKGDEEEVKLELSWNRTDDDLPVVASSKAELERALKHADSTTSPDEFSSVNGHSAAPPEAEESSDAQQTLNEERYEAITADTEQPQEVYADNDDSPEAKAAADSELGETDQLDARVAELWVTRERLYEMATEYDVSGRSHMSKEELIRGLLAAEINPLEQLRQKELYSAAQSAEVEGRSTMSQTELIQSLRDKASENDSDR